MKESETNEEIQGPNKISMAHDAVQAIKQLRREVVDSMRNLMKLAKEKQTQGMLPICEDMIKKVSFPETESDGHLLYDFCGFADKNPAEFVGHESGGGGAWLPGGVQGQPWPGM